MLTERSPFGKGSKNVDSGRETDNGHLRETNTLRISKSFLFESRKGRASRSTFSSSGGGSLSRAFSESIRRPESRSGPRSFSNSEFLRTSGATAVANLRKPAETPLNTEPPDAAVLQASTPASRRSSADFAVNITDLTLSGIQSGDTDDEHEDAEDPSLHFSSLDDEIEGEGVRSTRYEAIAQHRYVLDALENDIEQSDTNPGTPGDSKDLHRDDTLPHNTATSEPLDPEPLSSRSGYVPLQVNLNSSSTMMTNAVDDRSASLQVPHIDEGSGSRSSSTPALDQGASSSPAGPADSEKSHNEALCQLDQMLQENAWLRQELSSANCARAELQQRLSQLELKVAESQESGQADQHLSEVYGKKLRAAEESHKLMESAARSELERLGNELAKARQESHEAKHQLLELQSLGTSLHPPPPSRCIPLAKAIDYWLIRP
ncbi:hypothetical protein DFJ77DRAFT_481523 [Powellomyces hirtus]|nr:hypothetical protein DFJ77DRAFT_481523 [Powellomyces hirtus]